MVNKKSIISLYLILFLSTFSALSQKTAKNIYDENNTAVVYLEIFDQSNILKSSGSGFIVDSEGFIVTNYHVIENAYSINVTFADKNSEKVFNIFNYDKEHDLALIRVNKIASTNVKMLNSNSANIGDIVYALGSPLGSVNTITNGIISNIIKDNEDYVFQISAPISHGSSGGALFDDKGNVIGVTFASNENGQNLNYAIPSKYVYDLLSIKSSPISLSEFQKNNYSSVNFETGSLNDVMSKAKQENKIIMVDVLTDWCVWCVELDNLVYTRPDVYEYANTNMINYKIDAEKGEGIAFKEKYKVEGYPTILFLDGDGNEVDRIFGYYPAAQFKELMTDYSQKKNTAADLKARLEKDPNDIEANYKYADKLLGQNKPDEAKKLYDLIIANDADNKNGRTDDAKFMLADLSDKDGIPALQTFIKENPNSDVIKDAYMSLGNKQNTANDIASAEQTFKEALGLFPNDEQVKISYGRFLNSQARTIGKNEKSTEADFKKGLEILAAAIPYMPNSTGEAAAHYWESVFYFNLKDYSKAMEAIDKSLKIFNAKPYRDQKEKIEKQLTSK